jgi:hypothetical protein
VQEEEVPAATAGSPRRRALRFPHCANVDPVALCDGLAAAITSKYGGQLFEFSRVRNYDGPHVRLNHGNEVHARDAIVIATNTPIHRNLAIHNRQQCHRWVGCMPLMQQCHRWAGCMPLMQQCHRWAGCMPLMLLPAAQAGVLQVMRWHACATDCWHA